MADQTSISWADATFNPWIGCTRVSPACDHCYAARDNERRKWVDGWGSGVPRHRTNSWGDPRKWDRQAALTGGLPGEETESCGREGTIDVEPVAEYDRDTDM